MRGLARVLIAGAVVALAAFAGTSTASAGAPAVRAVTAAQTTVVRVENEIGSRTQQFFRVACPVGQRAVSGGWHARATSVTAFADYPEEGGTWALELVNTGTVPVRIEAYAVCTAAAFTTRTSTARAFAQSDGLYRSACLPGESVVGGGWAAADVRTRPFPGTFFILLPEVAAWGERPTPEQAWEVHLQNRGLSGLRTVSVFANCSTAPTVMHVARGQLGRTAGHDHHSGCGPGEQPIAGGWDARSYPVVGTISVSVLSDWPNQEHPWWSVRLSNLGDPRLVEVYVICVR